MYGPLTAARARLRLIHPMKYNPTDYHGFYLPFGIRLEGRE